tara:strand:+ start:274 stop:1224 length:951 start_codon:yes stop_codon:yes gene_type:complete
MKTVHVAVGVVIDEANRVLVALRAAQAHQGGLWEFPGGKCEPGETIEEALRRELDEELGIAVLRDAPLCTIEHDYGDKRVLLEVRRVLSFAGEAKGREGQAVRWAALDSLEPAQFPAANLPIIRRIQLADRIAITGYAANNAAFTTQFKQLLDRRPPLIHFRQHGLSDEDFRIRARSALSLCRAHSIPLAINTDPTRFEALGADALHVSSTILRQLGRRPVSQRVMFSASCHTLEELRMAAALQADYVLLSPVAATDSHPEQVPMGWARLAALISEASVPIYALGGMTVADIPKAFAQGAAGIAAISAFWDCAGDE